MAFTVHQINAGMDNTFYLAGDPMKKEGVLIDPFDGESALHAVEQTGWRVQAIVNTHGHWDHVGGNDAVRARFGIPTYAHPLEEVPHALPLGESILLGNSNFHVLHTPGHRPGHVCLVGEGCLFTGDTVFVAGCGNPKFGGDIDQLHASFQRLAGLDSSLWIYPGHNYAAKNLLFAARWEPDNAAIAEAEAHFTKASLRGDVHRSKLADELRWNVFFRLQSPALRQRLVAEGKLSADADDRAVFRTLRELRNTF